MLFILSKAVQPMLWPLNITLLLLLAAFLLRRRRPISRLTIAALVILFLFSWPIATKTLRYRWENAYPSLPISEYPKRDAIVVLGGTMAETRPPRILPEEMNGARVVMGWRLYRAGKAPLVICSGGVPYPGANGEERTEADDMADFIIELGVPKEIVWRERKSRTTYENAVYVSEMLKPLGKNKILLVTTAMHQLRSTALFRKAGFDVVTVPSSWFMQNDFTWLDLLPDVRTLFANTFWLKEVIGYGFFRALGKA